MPSPACRHRVLSQGPAAQVSLCSCGHVTINVGPVSLRVEPAVMRSLIRTLEKASEALENESEPDTHSLHEFAH